MRRLFKPQPPQAPTPRQLFLFVREGDKDHYWALADAHQDNAGDLLGVSFDASAPVEDTPVDVISFSPLDDVEVRAQRREGTTLLTKRLMAETGLQLIGWRQILGHIAQGQGTHLGLSGQLRQIVKRLQRSFSVAKNANANANGDGAGPVQAPDKRSLARSEWLYATPAQRMSTTADNTRIWAGRAMLRTLLAQAWSEQAPPESPYVTGVVMTGQSHTLVVFFKANEGGELDAMVSVDLVHANAGTPEEQAEVNHQRLEKALQTYLQHVRLASLDSASEFPPERICLFDGRAFVQLMVSGQNRTILRPYPRQVEILHVGVSTWWKLAMNLCALAFVGVLGTSIYASTLTAWTQRSTASASEALAQSREALRASITSRWGAITKSGSVPYERAIALAQQLHAEGLRMEIESDRELLRIKTIAKVTHAANTPEALSHLLQNAPPTGCQRRNPETNLQLSELYITYECTSVDPAVAQLLAGHR